jgi:hypothetical protein
MRYTGPLPNSSTHPWVFTPRTLQNVYDFDLSNLMLASGLDTWSYVNSDSHLAKLELANAGNWDAFFQGTFREALMIRRCKLDLLFALTASY